MSVIEKECKSEVSVKWSSENFEVIISGHGLDNIADYDGKLFITCKKEGGCDNEFRILSEYIPVCPVVPVVPVAPVAPVFPIAPVAQSI
jgi:hypothetical protein